MSKGGRPVSTIGFLARSYGLNYKTAAVYRLDRNMTPLALQCTLNDIRRVQEKNVEKVPNERETTVEALSRLSGKVAVIRGRQ